MKVTRPVVLTVAIATGGVAAMLAGGSENSAAPQPQAQTTDISVPVATIASQPALSRGDTGWKYWPASGTPATSARRSQRPVPIESTEDDGGTRRAAITVVRFGVATTTVPK
jgi:pilus assembly protein CpaB